MYTPYTHWINVCYSGLARDYAYAWLSSRCLRFRLPDCGLAAGAASVVGGLVPLLPLLPALLSDGEASVVGGLVRL